ncbi:MAG TPA: hypothetical protein VE643_01600 [Nitrososphaeraceae archaeon]|nr:hypothetical protein [Nitrososphaeraceae archaeon]
MQKTYKIAKQYHGNGMQLMDFGPTSSNSFNTLDRLDESVKDIFSVTRVRIHLI